MSSIDSTNLYRSDISIDAIKVADRALDLNAQLKKVLTIHPYEYVDRLLFPMMSKDQEIVTVFTDGSFAKRVSGIGVFFGDNDARNVSRRLTLQEQPHTNNRGELTAIHEALKIIGEAKGRKYIILCTDSEYSINVLTLRYEAKANKDTIFKILVLISDLLKNGNDMQFHYTPGHTRAPDKNSDTYQYWYGNDQADLLATRSTGYRT